MLRSLFVLTFLLFAAPALAAGAAALEGIQNLYSGDALYYAHQGDWLEAIVRLDANQARLRAIDKARFEAFSGRFSVAAGRFELNYRMHQRAGRAMKAVIEGAVDDRLRNEALFCLARMYVQKDQPEEALRAVKHIRGDVPEAIRADLVFLRAHIAMAVGRAAEAVAILKDMERENTSDGLHSTKEDVGSESISGGFRSYNLGIALLRSGSVQDGRHYLDRAGRIASDDRATPAMRDKANLVLGELLLRDKLFPAAKEVLDRVRLSGPFSNRALLSSGWADAMQERYDRALVTWGILAGREVADPAVQEALLAVPYAYGRLGVYGNAALKYEAALDAFSREIIKLETSIAGIREGALLRRLAREDVTQDAAWIVKLRELPLTPETSYLLDLVASHDFQESLKNYLDLEHLRKKLEGWFEDLNAFEDIIRLRWAHYQPLLPEIDREFKRLELRMRSVTEQRDGIARLVEAMRTGPRPELLMTADEQALGKIVARLERMMTPRSEQIAPVLWHRIRRLRGMLVWNLYADYDWRFAGVCAHLRELDQELDMLKQQHADLASTYQTARESFQGYVDVLSRLRQGIEAARKRVRTLTARQGHELEIMAVNELTRQRDRLEAFRVKARYALADSYDRAGKVLTQKRAAK